MNPAEAARRRRRCCCREHSLSHSLGCCRRARHRLVTRSLAVHCSKRIGREFACRLIQIVTPPASQPASRPAQRNARRLGQQERDGQRQRSEPARRRPASANKLNWPVSSCAGSSASELARRETILVGTIWNSFWRILIDWLWRANERAHGEREKEQF